MTDTFSRVTVLGTGLIGTSVALAVRHRGVEVLLADSDTAALWQSVERGAGSVLLTDAHADLVVIATPPSAVAGVLLHAQRRGLGEVYTDVASIKAGVIQAATDLGCDLTSYVPGHPLAGGESSGPTAARADLFVKRPWVLCPTTATRSEAVNRAAEFAGLIGATVHVIDADTHDRAMALVSHAPHVLSSAMAARLADTDSMTLALVGNGLRDVIRIAAGNTQMWTDILTLNAQPVAHVLDAVAYDLKEAADSLRSVASGHDEAASTLTKLLADGNAGQSRALAIPGETNVNVTSEF